MTHLRRIVQSAIVLATLGAGIGMAGLVAADLSTASPAGASIAPSGQTLYVGNLDTLQPAVAGFALPATGNQVPTSNITQATTALINDPYGMAVDANGNLWVSSYEGGTVDMFTPGQINAGGSPTPSIVLHGIDGSAGLGFDHAGNLWVASYSDGTLSEFTPSQLATTGTPTAAVTITSDGTSLVHAEELTFDAAGNLWVSSADSSDYSIQEFTPSQLASSGHPFPAVTLSTNGSNSVDYPTGLAFDSAGDLWVANNDGTDQLVEFAPSLLKDNGGPDPTAILTSDGTSSAKLDDPWEIGFDGGGDLWVANEGNNSVAGFSPSQLSASGNPMPTYALAGSSTGLDGPVGLAIAPAPGYWLVASDGGIFTHGNAQFDGSQGATALNQPIVGMAATPDGGGYWLVASDGGIFTHGDAVFYGSQGATKLNKPIVGMASTPDGQGYWLVASDGGIFAHGDAIFYGSQGATPLNKPIVGMASTPDGGGYWLVASDGGIFAHGDAIFYGSQGATPLNKPVVGMAATPDGKGYWLVASDGGIFTHGDAVFDGSQGATPLNKPIVGMTATPDGGGYWLVASDGGIFTHGDAQFFGSQGATALNKPIVGMAAS